MAETLEPPAPSQPPAAPDGPVVASSSAPAPRSEELRLSESLPAAAQPAPAAEVGAGEPLLAAPGSGEFDRFLAQLQTLERYTARLLNPLVLRLAAQESTIREQAEEIGRLREQARARDARLGEQMARIIRLEAELAALRAQLAGRRADDELPADADEPAAPAPPMVPAPGLTGAPTPNPSVLPAQPPASPSPPSRRWWWPFGR